MDKKTESAILALVCRNWVETPVEFNRSVTNIILNDVFAFFSEVGTTPAEASEYRPDFLENLSDLAYLRSAGLITAKHVKELIPRAWKIVGLDLVEELRDSKILEEEDTGKITEIVNRLLDENPKIVEQILGGKTSAIGSFVGKTLKEIGGKGNPAEIKELISNLISERSSGRIE